MLEHETVGQFGDSERGPLGSFLSRRVLAMRHRAEDGLCSPSGGLWRGLPDVPDGEAADGRASSSACPVDHDVGHDPARPHADAETRQLGVPDCELLCPRLQFVYDAFGDPVVSHD